MSFAGSGSASAGFAGRQEDIGIVGDIPSDVSFAQLENKKRKDAQEALENRVKDLDDKVKNRIKEIENEEELSEEDQKALDDFAEEFWETLEVGEIDQKELEKIVKLQTDSLILDNLELVNQSFAQQFINDSIRKYGINPLDENDVNEESSLDEYKQLIGDEISAEFNNLMDGIGKIFDGLKFEGVDVFNDLEAYTDVIRSIIDNDPRYLKKAVLERLGVEFDDEGNFSLENTIKDNLQPIIGRYLGAKVLRPMFRSLRGNISRLFGYEIDDVLLAEVMAEEQAIKNISAGISETLGDFLGRGAGTEALADFGAIAEYGFAPMLVATGVLESVGALGELSATMLGKLNTQHRAFTEENHQWFGDDQEWLRYTGPIYNAMKGVADLVMEIRDYQDWQAGTTTYQQYLEDKLTHDLIHSAFQEGMEHIAKQEEMTLDKTLELARNTPTQGGEGTMWEKMLGDLFKQAETATDKIGAFFGNKKSQDKLLNGESPREKPKTTQQYIDDANELLKYFQDVRDGVINNDYGFDDFTSSNTKLGDYTQKSYEEAIKSQYEVQEELVREFQENTGFISQQIFDLEDKIRYQKNTAIPLDDFLDFGTPKEERQARKELKKLQNEKAELEKTQKQMRDNAFKMEDQMNETSKILEAMRITPFFKSQSEYKTQYEQERRDEIIRQVQPLRSRIFGDMVRNGIPRREAERYAFEIYDEDEILQLLGMTEEDVLEQKLQSFDNWEENYFNQLDKIIQDTYKN